MCWSYWSVKSEFNADLPKKVQQRNLHESWYAEQFHWQAQIYLSASEETLNRKIEIEKNFGKGSKITYITTKPYFFQVGT